MLESTPISHKRPSSILRQHLLFLMIISLMVGPMSFGCKNKKKLAEEKARQEAAAKQREIDKTRSDLQALMATSVRDMDDLEDRESVLADIKSRNIADSGIQSLIQKVENFLERERKRLQAEMAPPPPPRDPMADLKGKISQQFDGIARAGNTNIANANIEQTMGMFSSQNAPVLIIISQENGNDDYDRPTTIQKYLNYLKDQRKNPNDVYNVVTDASGKIKELILIKK